ncbi:uroporphyrinogen-III synthase [Plastoroseomonas arctica]|uniref:Uroporphyrinogen-III synthase n=1 Tax=Plastoroseomonas arctica TaxID=1509237 RepID=A0AAF1JZ00_9PROT|nr:uroporphyrinogen-III synthase [Plastoroseomonas arctica]MBR0657452.1 uroporphyrinogen-III synthase [Plastoroseomonas arctica]
MQVLITRPEPGASETALAVAALGWTPVLAPALTLASVPFALPPRIQAVLIASRAAARALPRTPLPVYAVGQATAADAIARGLPTVVAAEGDAAALAALVAERLDPGAGPLLLAVGEGYGAALTAMLRARGFRVLRRVAYRAAPAESLPEAARAGLAQGMVAAALFFSPRSATRIMELFRDAGLVERCTAIDALALSPRIATTLRSLPWRCIRATSRPDPAALLDMLGRPPE